MTTTAVTHCPNCFTPVTPGTLLCPRCGHLTHRPILDQLASAAIAREHSSPHEAAHLWNQTLQFLPPEAPQRPQIQGRIQYLLQQPAAGSAPSAPLDYAAPQPKQDDPLPVALVKTVGSMLISIAVYSYFFGAGWQFATGFVLLILVHELGHVAAMRYYGLSASPPIFIPFVGALINLRQSPRNAFEEAVVGIGGPALGTLGSIACLAWGLNSPNHRDLLILLAHFGFMLNLFNMLPVPPLDGGRVTAAVSPWLWMPGLLVLAAWIVYEFLTTHRLPFLLIFLLLYALPRIKATLAGRQREHPYYQIPRPRSAAIGIAYLVLGLTLLYFFRATIPIVEVM